MNRRKLLKLLGLSAATPFIPLIARSQCPAPIEYDFYISPTGDNGGSGNLSSPWAITALEANAAQIFEGAKVGILGGPSDIYRVTNVGTGAPGGLGHQIGINCSGVPGNPTIIQCVNPIGSGPRFTQNNGSGDYSPGNFNVGMFGVNGSWLKVRMMRCEDLAWAALIVNGTNLLFEGIDVFDVRFSRSGDFLSGDNCPGIRLGETSTRPENITFRHCRVNHVRNGPGDEVGSENGAAFQCYTSKNVIWEHCTALDCDAGYYVKNWMNGAIVRNCFAGGVRRPFYGIQYNSTTWQDGGAHTGNLPHTIEGCVAEACEDFFDGDVSDRAADMIVRNNTVVFSTVAETVSGQAKYSSPQGASDPFTVEYRDNIMFYRGGRSFQHRLNGTIPASQMFTTLDRNAYPVSGFAMESNGTFPATLAAWRTHVGGGREANSIQTDGPQFVNGNGVTPEDYKLQSGSPCEGTGTDGQNMGAYRTGSEQIGHNFALLPEI